MVVDVLRARAAALGVEECCEARVRKLTPPKSEGKLWTLTMDDGHFERASAVVVATGGQDALDFLPEDVEVYPFAPVLGPLKTDTTLIRALDNIRVKCRVTLMRDGEFEAEEQGELLFRKYGVSGICVFDLSSVAEPGDVLEIDFLPDEKEEKIANLLASRRRRLLAYEPEARMQDLFRGLLLPSVAEAVCAAAEVDAAAKAQSLTKAQKDAFARALKHFPLTVEGIADPAQCQVHRGGVDGYELSSEMEYATHPGLYFAGEAVDVDGPCGGYNLHWAWASGLVAGSAAARSVIKKSGPV